MDNYNESTDTDNESDNDFIDNEELYKSLKKYYKFINRNNTLVCLDNKENYNVHLFLNHLRWITSYKIKELIESLLGIYIEPSDLITFLENVMLITDI